MPGLIEKPEFEPRITGLRQRIQSWEAQIDSMRDEAARQATLSLIIGRLEDFAKRVQDRMADVDWAMRRDLIRVLVKRVEIHPADVNIVFRIDRIASMPEPGGSDDQADPTTLHSEEQHQDGGLSGHFLQDCGRRDHSAAGQHLPALRPRPLGPSMAPTTGARSGDDRALCRPLRDGLREGGGC